jgi:hypothetical protein
VCGCFADVERADKGFLEEKGGELDAVPEEVGGAELGAEGGVALGWG